MKAKIIYKGIISQLQSMLTAYDMIIPILSSDISEKPIYPSIKIIIDEENTYVDTKNFDFNSFTLKIYYFPPNRLAYLDAHLDMKDALKDFFNEKLIIENFEIYNENGISFNSSDGILIAEIDYEWYEQKIYKDDSEIMEDLNFTI